MNIAEKEISCAGEVFTLTNERVIYWEKENALVLSDLHIGKSATFRKSGIPIAAEVLAHDLNRLGQLIDHFSAHKLIVVGDLFHAEFNQDIQFFMDWCKAKENLKIDLILGNHDRLSSEIYEKLNLTVYTGKHMLHSICFVHENAEANKNMFTISGHIHPGVILKGKGKQKIKLPCFQVTAQQLILPAFSNFTGLNTQSSPKNCTNFAFTAEAIFEIH